MDPITMCDGWWQVVVEMTRLLEDGYEEIELTEYQAKNELSLKGYSKVDIDRACKWIEKAEMSGNLGECLAMIKPSSDSIRVSSPMEKAYFSELIWSTFEKCRSKAVLSHDMVEQLLEGIRIVDPRDWEDEDVLKFFKELIGTVLPHLSEYEIAEILNSKQPNYC